MLTFFRRHQKIIFLFVTAIIILSFSFFGTYSTISSAKIDDPVLFTTKDGQKVRKIECNSFIEFLSTGPTGGREHKLNLFNDGFLARDILSTCVGEAIFDTCSGSSSNFLKKKKELDANFRLYQHPKAPFMSTEQVWTYFAPNLKESFVAYQKYDGTDARALFKKKSALYVEESQFPANFVKQVLLYQERQANWLEPDVTLQDRDFSLFGYTSALDWFGPEYMQRVAQVVLSGAEQAKDENISVSEEEVVHSLYKNIQQAASRYPDLSRRPINELVEISLHSLGLDFATVKTMWHNILLYRKAFTNVYDHVAISGFPFKSTYADRARYRTVDSYELQPALKVNSTQDLGELYVWRQAVCAPNTVSGQFSRSFLPADEVVASWPEFVQERINITYRLVGPEQIEPLIRVKELWHWQGLEANFNKLAEKFPTLLENAAQDPESRMKAIERLSPTLRSEVDAYSKKLFVADHPEWIDEQIKHKEKVTKALFIRPDGSGTSLEGISDLRALLSSLKKEVPGEQSETFRRYTQDGLRFYEIMVLDRSSGLELVPLIQLREDGSLAKVLRKLLDTQYSRLRKQNPKAFLTESGEWKPISEVRSAVLELYLAPLFSSLDQMKQEIEKKYPGLCAWDTPQDVRFALFFLPLILDNVQKLEAGEAIVTTPIQVSDLASGSKDAVERAQNELYSFVKTTDKIRFDQVQHIPQLNPLFKEVDRANSLVVYLPRTGAVYLKALDEGVDSYNNELRSTLYSLGEFISESARRQKIEDLLRALPEIPVVQQDETLSS